MHAYKTVKETNSTMSHLAALEISQRVHKGKKTYSRSRRISRFDGLNLFSIAPQVATHLTVPIFFFRPLFAYSSYNFYGAAICIKAVYALQGIPRSTPRAGSGVVRMDPLRFLAGCRTRRLNQA